jgi:hypothetical protein
MIINFCDKEAGGMVISKIPDPVKYSIGIKRNAIRQVSALRYWTTHEFVLIYTLSLVGGKVDFELLIPRCLGVSGPNSCVPFFRGLVRVGGIVNP